MAEITPDSIRSLRRRLGLSQAAFAALINDRAEGLRTNQVTVARWEKGTFGPSGVVLHVLRMLSEEVIAEAPG